MAASDDTWTATSVTTATTTRQGGLASTGASAFAPIVIGLVLVCADIGPLLVLRRRT